LVAACIEAELKPRSMTNSGMDVRFRSAPKYISLALSDLISMLFESTAKAWRTDTIRMHALPEGYKITDG